MFSLWISSAKITLSLCSTTMLGICYEYWFSLLRFILGQGHGWAAVPDYLLSTVGRCLVGLKFRTPRSDGACTTLARQPSSTLRQYAGEKGRWSKLLASLKNTSHSSPGGGRAVQAYAGERWDSPPPPKCMCLRAPEGFHLALLYSVLLQKEAYICLELLSPHIKRWQTGEHLSLL